MTEKELFSMVGIRPEPAAPKKKVNRLKGFPWVSVVLMGAIVLCCLFAEVLINPINPTLLAYSPVLHRWEMQVLKSAIFTTIQSSWRHRWVMLLINHHT